MGTSRDVQFSVVVPTRNRPDTLQSTLRTCVDQAWDSYEIIVSDNQSAGYETQTVTERLNCPRLQYYRTPAPLAMSDNWEFGLSKASGEYVIVLGDDDGLLPDSLPKIDQLLQATQAKLLRWDRVDYYWPSCRLEGSANRLRIPLGECREDLDGRKVITDVAGDTVAFTQLPTLYGGIAHRDLIAEFRRAARRVFSGTSPDVYAGFGLAYLAREYVSVSCPMSIMGLSGHSNGLACTSLGGDGAIAEDFRRLNDLGGFRSDTRAPRLPVLQAIVADMFWQAKARLFPDDGELEVDRRALITTCARTLKGLRGSLSQDALQALRDSTEDDPSLRAWFDHDFSRRCEGLEGIRPWIPAFGVGDTHLVVDASRFGVQNVWEAARLCDQLLEGRHHGWAPPPIHPRLSFYRRLRAVARILLTGR